MHTLRLLLLSVMTAVSPLLTLADSHINGVITANAGTRFQLGESGTPGVLAHTVTGVAQVSVIGNCTVHFDVLAYPATEGEPWKLEGTMELIHPKDHSTLSLKVTGWVLPESGTPFGNFHYDAEILSGEGQFSGARGEAEINGVAMFINPEWSEGTATWTLKGKIFTRP